MKEDLEKAINILKKYNQEELLNKLENKELLDQILKIDFEKVNEIYSKTIKENKNIDDKIENIDYTDESKLSSNEKEKLEDLGNNIIKQGKYAVVTMAGGQRNKTWSCRTKRNIQNRCKS